MPNRYEIHNFDILKKNDIRPPTVSYRPVSFLLPNRERVQFTSCESTGCSRSSQGPVYNWISNLLFYS